MEQKAVVDIHGVNKQYDELLAVKGVELLSQCYHKNKYNLED